MPGVVRAQTVKGDRMARTEYYDDPQAPKPNSLVVAASAVVTDGQGRILLQRRRDNELWALPGGGLDMDDSLPGTAVREVKEETGLDVEITGLSARTRTPGTSSRTATVRSADSSTCASRRVVGGDLAVSDESTGLRFVAPVELDSLPMHHTQRLRLEHFLEHRTTPCLG
ncbi:putative MutT/NUDIX-like protein [Streptomyces purpureus]|uniref:MutT/NUDIX-like protein n=2 Tax=Streptomyces purpureus TaxID=1951 RepID=A0A918H3B6_9ACTN|nr:putative MutT/NUDIX-like protein [Streptomyces purpureus]